MAGTVLGIRHEAIIRRDKVASFMQRSFQWGGWVGGWDREGSKEKTQCMITKRAESMRKLLLKITRTPSFDCGQASSLSEEKWKESTEQEGQQG